MKANSQPLEQPKQQQIHSLLESANFGLLCEHIAAEIAQLECEALTVVAWVDKSANAKMKFDLLLTKITDRKSALDLFKAYNKPEFQFISVTINP